jgi:predicted O-methyltransferase YrrM
MAETKQAVKISGRAGPHPWRIFLDQAVREYRDKVAERVLGRPLHKPWMKYREIAIIDELLASLRPFRALEWGVGYGTLHFPRLLPPGSEWIAIEHDAAWAERIRSLEPPSRVRIHSVPPEREHWKDPNQDGSYADFESYVEFPARLGGEFDFILIDGRARLSCLRRAHSLLAPDGVVVLHDANREFLRDPWRLYPQQAEFSDYRRWTGGLWIGSHDRDIAGLVDMGKHRRMWHWYNRLGKGLRL